MKPTFAPRATWLCLYSLLWVSLVRLAVGQTNGIFAEFNTSMGSFTCVVEYAKAPKAAANFIGLATGEQPWLDLTTGLVRSEPFYDGLIFHRVIAGFMNQCGSPNGEGTDGPGYTFVDEFDPALRHNSFGVLSSANLGPDSNGAQFFITVEPTPWLDDVHTIFGGLIGGSNVVYAINHVATDDGDKPLTNVVLQSVVIRRVGAEATAFNIHAQGLPVVTALNTGIARVATNVSIAFGNQLNVDDRLYSTTNLVAWSGTKLGIEVALPVTNSVVRPINQSKQFFRMAQVQYPDSLHVPRNVLGATLDLNFTSGQGTLALNFDQSGTGTYAYQTNSVGTIDSYTWIQDAYRGRLYPIYFSGLIPMVLHLDYDSASAGTFKGTAYPSSGNPIPVYGVFGASP